MSMNLAQKLIASHLVEGGMNPGEEIALSIDQTLTQDATGTLVMLELEAMGLERVRTEVSAQYVDHNLIQQDNRNPDDHLFLESACRRFGLWYSRPGNGVSHPVHMQQFGTPGKTLLGADSHTCAAGGIGMLAIGAGGLEVAAAMAGHPFHVTMPRIWGITLTGALPDWVSAKDVILEMLRRHGVSGGIGRIIEYRGEGVKSLSTWDRHVIANMGAELGATTTVFPSDERTREFLVSVGRHEEWIELKSDEGASYDDEDTINLSELVPLIAKPSSPGNVVPVSEVVGEPIYQAYIGSSANPGYRDFAVVARIVAEKVIADKVSLDINPTSRSLLQDLIKTNQLGPLLQAGARLHQAGCNGCIGMGQAPATDQNSLRTTPRNFPGRSGVREDRVWLCSPETAAASALTGYITDPRTLVMPCPKIEEPERVSPIDDLLLAPLPPEEAQAVDLVKGPNIVSLPLLDPLPDHLVLPVLLKMGDDISTDEIMPAGARVLPYRSNIPKIAEFAFDRIDPSYHDRAIELRELSGHAVIGGINYGQGSSREHAALAPRFLGLRVVLVKDFARIHKQNLVNFGVLPLTFADPLDYNPIEQGMTLVLDGLHAALRAGERISVRYGDTLFHAIHGLTDRQIEILLAGGLIPWLRSQSKQRLEH